MTLSYPERTSGTLTLTDEGSSISYSTNNLGSTITWSQGLIVAHFWADVLPELRLTNTYFYDSP